MWNKISWLLIGMLAICVSYGGTLCSSETKGAGHMKFDVTSSAFGDGTMIPKTYTCQGRNISPPLSWGAVPEQTQSIALILEDPDAPMGTFVHWVLFNLPADTKGLPENVPAGKTLANGAKQGAGTSKKVGYMGPCPPSGTHRYFFKVYALDSKLGLESGSSKERLLKAMHGHILAEGQLMGTYKRH
ncbi:MAG: YbhB/YbcL family Raf kinase inhibitor-like protein [Desulfomonilaceae bacterium]